MAHTPRLYVSGHITPGPLLLDSAQSRRLAAVMRMREGDEFILFGGDGREWGATVASVAKTGMAVTVGDIVRQAHLPALSVEVWCGLVRPNRFDWAIEKCVEAGADVIRPLLSEFSARGEGASKMRTERWMRIAVEAAEQSGRLFLPVVEEPRPFESLLERTRRVPVVLAERSGEPWRAVAPLLPEAGGVVLAIGPEGGFSDAEVASAKAHGALLASLGSHILRTETAAVVATAILRASS